MQFEFINEIPDDLPVGEYTTRVVKTGFKNGEFLTTLEFLGKPYDSDNPTCLFPITKSDIADEV